MLEAQQRVGGRVHTLREPFTDGLYAEAGAMRIPRSHDLTMAYFEHFRLPTRAVHDGQPERATSTCTAGGGALGDVAGRPGRARRSTLADARARPHRRTTLWARGDRGARRPAGPTRATPPGPRSCSEYDQLLHPRVPGGKQLVRGRDRDVRPAGRPGSADELVLPGAAARGGRRYYTDMVQIDGGMDQLPRAFLPALRRRIRFGARMVAIEQSPDAVTVHYQTAGRPLPRNRRLRHPHGARSRSCATWRR